MTAKEGTHPTLTAPALSPGKYRRLGRLSDEEGRFAMLAIDQRRSLRAMIGARTGQAPADVGAADLRLVKRVVTEGVAPLATAILTDPIFGYPSTFGSIPARVGVMLSAEVTGYTLHEGRERRSRLLDGWSAAKVLRTGADAVKLLIWHHPEASAETGRHQAAIVGHVGDACADAELPFVLEVVTYSLEGAARGTPERARRKAELVVDAARTYSDPSFRVDLLKLEFPAELRYAQEYQGRSFGRRPVLYDRAGVEAACAAVEAAARAPWVILSAGVEPEEFAENIRLANAAGASGFLGGRAVWQHVLRCFPDEAAMRAFVEEESRAQFRRIRAVNKQAASWMQRSGIRD